MESRVKLFGHPIHPMLIPFPIGLFTTAVVFDLIYLIAANAEFARVAFWLVLAGVIGGLAAAPFGLIDWLALPSGTRAKTVGALHGIGNVVVVLLFAVSFLLRLGAPDSPSIFAIVLSVVGLLLATVTAWMGGELVDRLRVGVDDGAHLNSPSSLSGRPAAERPG